MAPAPTGYSARWWRLDNTDAAADREIGTTEGGTSIAAPPGLPDAIDSYVAVDLAAIGGPHAAWHQPVRIVFRRQAAGWQHVGLER